MMQTTIPKLLPLDRPLVVFDLETTGLATAEDKIVEVAYEKILPSGEIIAAVHRINPGRPIPSEASAIHGIYDADVAEAPSFAKLSYELWNMFDGADVSGFNIVGFDIPMLKAEFARVGKNFDLATRKVLDAKVLYHSKVARDMFSPRTLTAAYKFFCDKDHIDAHTGAADVRATVEILEEELKRYPEFCNWATLAELHGKKDLLESAKTEHAPVVTKSAGTLF